MKSLMPWFCLVATASATTLYANDGVDAYRRGHYTQAAEVLVNDDEKDPVINYYMGRMRLYGYGQLKNNIEAIRYFKGAAEKGFLPAQQFMARYSLTEEHNPAQALYWFKKAADANDTSAQLYCAAAYLFGVGVKKNTDMAKRYVIAAAKNGDSNAQYALAQSFLDSRQAANKKLGLLWLNKAVEQQNVDAQLTLAALYTSGTLVTRDLDKAKALIAPSLVKGSPHAMYQMGEIARQQGDLEQAKTWYMKAANANDASADMALSQLYTQAKSPLFNLHEGFLWMLKAAQAGSTDAERALAVMYKHGQGVEADEQLAQEWQKKATASPKEDSLAVAEAKASAWLSHGKAQTLAASGYALQGILSDWKNPEALKENNYNQAPQMDVVTRESLYKPSFVMIDPNDVAISDYYDALAILLANTSEEAPMFPRYAFDKQALVLPKQSSSAVPKIATMHNDNKETNGTSAVAIEPAVLTYLQERAALGDTTAQFSLGQLYQYGEGVAKNSEEAIKYYQLAAAQQELRAEYNLGVLYLEGHDVSADYQKGISLLRDAAFKGNDYAQYALARVYETGYPNTGEQSIKPDLEQAMAMYNLAAANDYSLAEYRLAQLLMRNKKADMTVLDKQKRNQLVKNLYQGAFSAGMTEAALPLAFFNAMSRDKAKQAEALMVAKKEASGGNTTAALLLGLLYDRGIAVQQSQDEAIHWYEKAPTTPVSAFILGTYYSEGKGVDRDLQKGKALLQQAAEGGFSYASFNLAIMKQQKGDVFLPELTDAFNMGNGRAGLLLADYYLSLANNEEQMKQARDIYQRLAEKGDKDGQLKLAFMFDRGLGGPNDIMSAQKWYLLAAEQGQVVASYLLGQLYQLGRLGTQPDYAEAKKWYSNVQNSYIPAAVALGFIDDTVTDDYSHAAVSYQLAAEKHDPVGLFNLGLIYEKGKGRPVDFIKAKDLYSEAAAQGHHPSMVQLAGLYFNGLIGTRNEAEGLHWYKKAAALGDRDALYQLGLLSETGVATTLDFPDAIHYYQLAADKGNAKAMLALARMSQYGIGMPKNTQQAMSFYKKLAALGNAYAQYQLGTLYYEGVDGSAKIQEGKQWLKRAQENGCQQASRALQWLDAQSEHRLSFIEPVLMMKSPVVGEVPVDLMYMDALNEWNRGNERLSRLLLNRIMVQFPQYIPAKRTYEQLNQQSMPGIVS